jgi:hypothetical protein
MPKGAKAKAVAPNAVFKVVFVILAALAVAKPLETLTNLERFPILPQVTAGSLDRYITGLRQLKADRAGFRGVPAIERCRGWISRRCTSVTVWPLWVSYQRRP